MLFRYLIPELRDLGIRSLAVEVLLKSDDLKIFHSCDLVIHFVSSLNGQIDL